MIKTASLREALAKPVAQELGCQRLVENWATACVWTAHM